MQHPTRTPGKGSARLAAAALLLLPLLGLIVRAQDPPQEKPPAAPQTPALVGAKATARDLAWLSGDWSGFGLGGQLEASWSSAAGGSLMGMFRLVAGEKAALYEFLMLEETPRGVMLHFKHYGPGYRAWEKDAPLSLLLVQCAEGRAVFQSEDPKQSPARLVYSLSTSEKSHVLSLFVQNPEHLPEPRSFEIVLRRMDDEEQR